MIKERKYYLDILRILACFLVIANHTNYVFGNVSMDFAHASMGNAVASTLYLAVCKCAVTIFLMMTGCLMLGRKDDYRTSLIRVMRILLVIVVFSLPYYFIGDFDHSLENFVLVVGRAQVTTAYWYLYLYLGIIVMMPILQRAVTGFEKKDYLYFFVFSIFLCTFSFFTEFNCNFKLPVFTTFLGILVLGYYLEYFVECQRKWLLPLIGGIVLILVFLVAVTIYKMKIGSDYAPSLLHYDNIFYIAMTAALFLVIKILCSSHVVTPKAGQILKRISTDTFGIYLVSDLLIHYLEPHFEQYNNIAAVIVLDVIVFVLGMLITEVLRKVPLISKLL